MASVKCFTLHKNTFRLMQRNPVFLPLCQHSRLSAETKQGSVHVAWSVAEMFLYFQLYLEDRAMMGDSLMFESIVF